MLGVDNRAIPQDLRGSIEIQYLDIGNPLSMLTVAAGCDAILHLAAYPSPTFVTSAELLRVNVIGTQNILDSAVANGIGRVVLTSSIGALGFSFPTHPCLPDYLPVDAAHLRRPQDIYGVSKLMNEESANATTRLKGLTTIVIRPPEVRNLARAAEHGWLSRWLERNLEHRNTGLWSYIDEIDLARAYRLALDAPLTGHHVFHVMADDVSAQATPLQLIERHLPQLTPIGFGTHRQQLL